MNLSRILLAVAAMGILVGCQSDPPPDPAAAKLVPEAQNGGTVPTPNGEFNQTSDRN